ncbi:basic-leucine zipper transcription factor A-like isoform X2 [Ceratina calcarata]|uniref:Basic-leucine zipper transcription factor A-like isoform X2 n=1 Tax=Ceratina calcarata TaxID=156304 RepID=A0AAJ7RVG7_9HYME|nr:basic-leucine zipper transcription factor A-like isoform X2 [Ceratina calcarata]
MASTMLVKLPTVPFPQGKKSPSDIVALTERNDGINQNARHQAINLDRVAQLEQNMKFLQEQHQATLVALHQEVESLRQKNRDLQFQLVFSKGSTYVPSSPSSPEDNGTGFAKQKGSPICVNITPLQVELLEKELQDTKLSLQEAKTQNQQLTEIVEEQKQKASCTEERTTTKEATVDVGIQVGDRLDPVRADLVACLDGAEAMIKRLRAQNDDQKEEIARLKAASTSANGNKGARSRDSNTSRHSRGSPTDSSQEQTPHVFPPLQNQRHWHHRSLRNGRNRHYKSMEVDSLPQLQNGNAKQDGGMPFESMCYRSRGHRNYYRDEGNQKYRGKGSQTDHKDSDNNHHHHHHNNHHYRRDYKERSTKNHSKEFTDKTEKLRETDNSTASKS